MPKRKTTWECGHSGQGKFCHRCEQVRIEALRAEEARLAKKQAKLKNNDVVDLSVLPESHQITARDIIRRIENGVHWSRCGGRRLRKNQTYVVFELGLRWRLIGTDKKEKFEFLQACSHQEYNTVLGSH